MTKLRMIMLAGAAAFGVTSAQAADLIISAPPSYSPGIVQASGGNWDGVYLGVFGGWASGLADHTSQVPGNDIDISGGLLGLTAGANFTLTDGVVAGIVGDIAWSDVTGDNLAAYGSPIHTIDWQGSLRGRLGVDAGAFMPYVTGGVAFAHGTRESTVGGTADAMHVGWTAGAGVEVAVADNISLDLQYRYSDFGSKEYDWSGPGTNPTVNLTQHAITAGLNFSF